MVTIPPFVWRSGSLGRGLITGASVGLLLGTLVWIDSGFVLAGACVFVIVGVCFGIWMARRMSRYWPEAAALNGAERVAVAGAARRGERVDDSRLAKAAQGYRRGMHAAARTARPLRWLLIVVLIVAIATALWDMVFGSVGSAVASAIYLVLLAIELFWWPRRQQELLSNADRACG